MAAATIQAETPHVRVSFAGAAERAFGGRFGRQLVPLGDRLDSILYGIDDRSVSQRIAVIAFAVRVVSAGIAYISQVLLARWMGDFEYGVFVVVWVGAVILGGLACLGFQTRSSVSSPNMSSAANPTSCAASWSAAGFTASSPPPPSRSLAFSASGSSATCFPAIT